MKKIIPLAIVAVALGLTGCSSPEPPAPAVPVSSECKVSLQKLKIQADRIYETATVDTPGEVLNAPEIYPLRSCSSFAEYSKAGIANPGAWGMTVNTEDDMEQLVISACTAVDARGITPVCADAKGLGLVP